MYVHRRPGEHMNREQAVALWKELGAKQWVQPLAIVIEQRKPNSYQLKIKGFYDCKSIEEFVQSRNLAFEENKEKGFLVIFKPQSTSTVPFKDSMSRNQR